MIPMNIEQRKLDQSNRDLQTFGLMAQDGEILMPVIEGETLTTRVLVDRLELAQQLPHTYVDDTVLSGVSYGEYCRGRRDTDSVQCGEKVHPVLLVSGSEYLAAGFLNQRGGISLAQSAGPGAFPMAHLEKLVARKCAIRFRVFKSPGDFDCFRIFLGDRYMRQKIFEGRILNFHSQTLSEPRNPLAA